jgi:hypothetical protein
MKFIRETKIISIAEARTWRKIGRRNYPSADIYVETRATSTKELRKPE